MADSARPQSVRPPPRRAQRPARRPPGATPPAPPVQCGLGAVWLDGQIDLRLAVDLCVALERPQAFGQEERRKLREIARRLRGGAG